MDHSDLIRELGIALGIRLEPDGEGSCGVFFGDDEIHFEAGDGRLSIMADLGPSEGREDAAARLLKAASLGLETGFACVGIDDMRGQFTLCRTLEEDLTYRGFEEILSTFVGAVRYWKEWLALPPRTAAVSDAAFLDAGALRL